MCLSCCCKSEGSQTLANHYYTVGFGVSDALTYAVGIADVMQAVGLSDHSSLEHKTIQDYIFLVFALVVGLSILAANYLTYLKHNKNYSALQKSGNGNFWHLNGTQSFMKVSGYITASVRAVVGLGAVVYALSKWFAHPALIASAYGVSLILMPGQFRSSVALYCDQHRDANEIHVQDDDADERRRLSGCKSIMSYALSLCFTVGAACLYMNNMLNETVHLRIPNAHDAGKFKTPFDFAATIVSALLMIFLFIATLSRYQRLIKDFLLIGGYSRVCRQQTDISCISKSINVTASVGKAVATHASVFKLIFLPLMKSAQMRGDLVWPLILVGHFVTGIATVGRLYSALALYFEKHNRADPEQAVLLPGAADDDPAAVSSKCCLMRLC